MSLALLFPGQGAQTSGHLHALPDCAAVRQTLDEASAALGVDALTLDTAEALQGTVATQLSLLIAGTAFARFLASEGVVPAAAAGMSVGVFAAAVAAGALALPDALQLVQLRAELMERAFPGGTHGMAVVEGLRRVQVEQLIGGSGATLANDNAPLQFVLAGPIATVEALCARAAEQGATRAERLRVAVPSHGEWLQPAAQVLRTAVDAVPVTAPCFPLCANRNARRVTTADKLREELGGNLAAPVLWRDGMEALDAAGTTLYLEAPPGHTLAGLVHVNLPEAQVLSAGERRWDSLVRAAQKIV